MTRPKKVVVGGIPIQIEFVKELADPADRNSFVFGLFKEKEQRILLNQNLPLDTQCSTLLHEILHSTWAYCAQPIKMLPETGGNLTEEVMVRNLEQTLFPILTDPRNRAVWNFILDR